MLKKTGFSLLGLVVMVSILFVAQAQTQEHGWKKTITLPSGEVVCDLTGEWDLSWVGRGEYQIAGILRDVLKLTQQGESFIGIRMIGNQWMPKGSTAIEGELDKNGFKKLIWIGSMGPGSVKGKISKDGNTIEIRASNYFDGELTRK